MAFYDFKISDKFYELNEVTYSIATHDALLPLSDKAQLFVLTRRDGLDDVFVASIVGDVCNTQDLSKWHKTFASFEKKIASSADKIAIMRTLQYLNNEEFKML